MDPFALFVRGVLLLISQVLLAAAVLVIGAVLPHQRRACMTVIQLLINTILWNLAALFFGGAGYAAYAVVAATIR